MYYNITGSAPVLTSTPITVNATETINAECWGQGYTTAFASGTYTISGSPTAATPTFSPAAGAIASGTTIAITSSTSGVTICYTLDGSTPTATTPGTCSHGTSISNGGSTTGITSPLTVEAIATEVGYINSGVGSAAYTVTGGGAAYVPGSYQGTTQSAPSVTSSTITCPSGGAFVLVSFLNSANLAPTGLPSISGTAQIIVAAGSSQVGTTGLLVQNYKIAACNPGTFTITATASGAQSALLISAYTGLTTFDTWGTLTSLALTSGVNSPTCSVTTSQTDTLVGEMVIGGAGYPYSFASVTWSSITSAFTTRSANPLTLGYLDADDIGAAAGTQNFTASETGTAGGSAYAFCFVIALH
jgi:hypothetical protein